MGVIYGCSLFLLMTIAFLAKREPTKQRKLFYKSGAFLFRKIRNTGYGRENTKKDMQALYPGRDIDKKVQAFYIEKIRIVLLIFLIGNLLSLSVYLYQQQASRISKGGVITKNSWEGGSFAMNLQAETEVIEEISVLVEPRSLTEEEAEILAEEVFIKLASVILQQNAGVEQITGKLNMVSRLENYPFRISWESTNPKIIKPGGEVENQQLPTEGEEVILTACLWYQDTYQDLRFQKDMELRVYPPNKSIQQKWYDEVAQAIEKSKEESAYEEKLQLPQTIRGKTVHWREKSSTDSICLWAMVLAAAFAIYAGQDKDLHKRVVKRDRQLDRSYPELVSKLALYLGAGITVKNAWKKIVQDYMEMENNVKSNVLCEEMMISCRELENGVSESEVYYRFGKRLGGNRYRKLSGLLSNHLQKGNKNLLQILREEADLALEERKNAARVTGEEMGTKLLFPMMIMLLIVMIIIMIPAYAMF